MDSDATKLPYGSGPIGDCVDGDRGLQRVTGGLAVDCAGSERHQGGSCCRGGGFVLLSLAVLLLSKTYSLRATLKELQATAPAAITRLL